MEDISIGDTVCDPSKVEGLPFVKISEPTVTMTFQVNDSPFAGREGTYVTSRHLRARLMQRIADGRVPAGERARILRTRLRSVDAASCICLF